MKSDVNEMKCDLKEYASIYARNTINVIGNGEELQSISKKNGFIVVITNNTIQRQKRSRRKEGSKIDTLLWIDTCRCLAVN